MFIPARWWSRHRERKAVFVSIRTGRALPRCCRRGNCWRSLPTDSARENGDGRAAWTCWDSTRRGPGPCSGGESGLRARHRPDRPCSTPDMPCGKSPRPKCWRPCSRQCGPPRSPRPRVRRKTHQVYSRIVKAAERHVLASAGEHVRIGPVPDHASERTHAGVRLQGGHGALAAGVPVAAATEPGARSPAGRRVRIHECLGRSTQVGLLALR